MAKSGSSVKVFLRESTGLVKNVSLVDAVTLNISNMSAGAALAVLGFTTILLPSSVTGFNLVLACVIAFLVSIPQIVVYTTMTQRLPRTGGDYVWVSRTFGGFIGGTFSFMGYSLETLAYLALIGLSTVFAIGSVGVSLGYSNMLSLSLPGNVPGANQPGQFGIAAVIFAALIAVNILRPKAGYRLVSVLTIFGILATVVAILTLLAAGRGAVVSYMDFLNTIGANTTYAKVASSYTGGAVNLPGTIFLLPFFAIFVFPWLNAAPAVASEIKGKSAVKWNVPISALIVFGLLTAAFATMYYVAGEDFINGALLNPTLVTFYSFNFWTLAMGVTSSVPLQWFIGLGWILWNVGILAYGIIVFSRYLFAQAFDRFLPTRLAYISRSFGSPILAHLIDLVLTVGLIGAASFLYGTISSLFGAIIAAMFYFTVIGLAVAVYAVRKEKGGTKGVLSICGVLMAVVFAYLASQFLAYPSTWGVNPLAEGYVAASFIIGAVIYLASKAYHRSRGVDITLAYKEIPPE